MGEPICKHGEICGVPHTQLNACIANSQSPVVLALASKLASLEEENKVLWEALERITRFGRDYPQMVPTMAGKMKLIAQAALEVRHEDPK